MRIPVKIHHFFRILSVYSGALALIMLAMPLSMPDIHIGLAQQAAQVSQTAEVAQPIQAALGPSGLPLPRFVSLKPTRVNVRVGPGREYAVSWLYTKAGLPVEIIQEYDNWRRIRDADGTEGWVYQSMLAGKRTAIIAPWDRDKADKMIDLHASDSDEARIVARLQPGVIGSIKECSGEWCRLDIGGTRGWIAQTRLWGAYPGENFD